MTTVATGYEHVVLNERGVPMIAGTTMKVQELVLEHIGYQLDAAALKDAHPYLTLGQIYSALAYYYDHRTAMDNEIQRGLDEADEIRKWVEKQPDELRDRLKSTGLIR